MKAKTKRPAGAKTIIADLLKTVEELRAIADLAGVGMTSQEGGPSPERVNAAFKQSRKAERTARAFLARKPAKRHAASRKPKGRAKAKPAPAPGITAEERKVAETLGAAWNAFLALVPYHSDDVTEFRHAIHAGQNIIAARVARRVNPEFWGPPGRIIQLPGFIRGAAVEESGIEVRELKVELSPVDGKKRKPKAGTRGRLRAKRKAGEYRMGFGNDSQAKRRNAQRRAGK